MKIQHPKALIRHQLQEAGVPGSEVHDLTERIAEAYEDVNGSDGTAGPPVDMPDGFGGAPPHDEPEGGDAP